MLIYLVNRNVYLKLADLPDIFNLLKELNLSMQGGDFSLFDHAKKIITKEKTSETQDKQRKCGAFTNKTESSRQLSWLDHSLTLIAVTDSNPTAAPAK